MRDAITSLDLTAVTRELKLLEGARIDKVYQRDKDITIHIYNPGDKKYRLFLAPGKAFLTDYKRDNPQQPPSFCMGLRKHLSGQRIERIEQHGFDRVLTIHTDEKKLVAELFGQGNIVLADKGTGDIINVMQAQEWSNRALYRGETYKPPEQDLDPRTMTFQDFKDLMGSRQIVKVLAADIGLGGVYAEEVLARTDVAKDSRSEALEDPSLHDVFEAMSELLEQVSEGDLDPGIYYDDDPVDVAPVRMVQYEDTDRDDYDSFSRALDTYFTERQKAEYRRQKREAYRTKKEKLERQKKQQEQMLEGMKASIDEKKELGDLIYEHYGTLEELIETLRKARKKYSEDEIRERLESEKANGVREAQIVEDINLAAGQVVVDLGEDNVTIDVDMGVEKNAERYYDKSKEAKRKVEGAKDALEETKRELEELEKNKGEIDVKEAFTNKKEKREKKRWYEKFRWFFSSDGFLVVGGRDQTSNEVLVKKHMQDRDRYVHADFDGAPSVVIKNPDDEEIPETTLKEAAQLAIGFSKAWKMNVAADDAYHVSPDQVTKDPESGEYLGKGAFVIRGDREYIRNVEVSAAVGAYEREDQILAMGGPISAVKTHCDHYVEVKQGGTKKSDVAKQIQLHLHESTGEDFDLDRIVRSLPPGECSVTGKH
jgi:predicted ribosome quality control (RQC) complex YloA/Tae2 family protein